MYKKIFLILIFLFINNSQANFDYLQRIIRYPVQNGRKVFNFKLAVESSHDNAFNVLTQRDLCNNNETLLLIAAEYLKSIKNFDPDYAPSLEIFKYLVNHGSDILFYDYELHYIAYLTDNSFRSIADVVKDAADLKEILDGYVALLFNIKNNLEEIKKSENFVLGDYRVTISSISKYMTLLMFAYETNAIYAAQYFLTLATDEDLRAIDGLGNNFLSYILKRSDDPENLKFAIDVLRKNTFKYNPDGFNRIIHHLISHTNKYGRSVFDKALDDNKLEIVAYFKELTPEIDLEKERASLSVLV